MNINTLFSLIAFVSSIILAVTIFSLSPPRTFFGRTYAAGMLFLLIIEFSFFMIFFVDDVSQSIFWGRIAISGFCLLLPTLSVVGLISGRLNYVEVLKKRVAYLCLTFGTSLIFLILVWKFDFIGVPHTFPRIVFLLTNWGKYFLGFYILITVAILINLENTLRLSKTASRKGKKGALFTLIGAFLFTVYAISQMLMYSEITHQLVLISLGIIVLTNLLFLFFIIKDGMKQMKVQIGREAVYSSAMIIIVGAYLIVIGLVGKVVQVVGGNVNLFLSFLAAFIVFSLLLATLASKSLKKRIKQFVDKSFYKNRYDYREQWGKFSESLSAVLSLDEMLATILENISDIFKAQKAALLLKDETSGAFVLSRTKNIENVNGVKFSLRSDFVDWFYRLAEAVEVSTLLEQAENIGLNKQEKENFKKLKAEVCVPLIFQRKFIGILTLGEKDSQQRYLKEDFELLETLVNQSSVTIQNAKLNEHLLVSRAMESFHNLTSFVLHDLRNSVSMLSMVIKNAEENLDNQKFQKDMLVTISNAVGRMNSLISKITSLPDKLEPKLQSVQVNDLIKKIMEDLKIKEFKYIRSENDFQILPDLSIDIDLFRKVMENLIINALEAMPEGGKLKVTTNFHNHAVGARKISANGFVEIEVSDTGTGISEEFIRNRLFKPFQTTKKKGLGVGLYQCKEIISAHNGYIEVFSKVNEGTSFKILLPVLNSANNGKVDWPDENKVEAKK